MTSPGVGRARVTEPTDQRFMTRQLLNKVPEVTMVLWIIKVLRAVRSTSPDATTEEAALTALLAQLSAKSRS